MHDKRAENEQFAACLPLIEQAVSFSGLIDAIGRRAENSNATKQ